MSDRTSSWQFTDMQPAPSVLANARDGRFLGTLENFLPGYLMRVAIHETMLSEKPDSADPNVTRYIVQRLTTTIASSCRWRDAYINLL